MINKILALFKFKPFLAILGFLFVPYYIWFRFIRERLPKEIPFNLTLVYFLILLCICIIYFYIILRSVIPKTPSAFILNIRAVFFSRLFIPFMTLEEYFNVSIYKISIIKILFEKCLILIANIVKKIRIYWLSTYINGVITTLSIGPTFLFLFLFLIDLYNNELNLIYKYILIQIIPLIFMYYVHLLKKYATNKIKALSTYYMIEIISEDTENKNYFTEIASLPFDEDYTSFYGGVDGEPEPLLEIEKFITLQADNILFDYDAYSYKCYIKDQYVKDTNVLLSSKEFDFWIPILVYNNIWIDIYNSPLFNEPKQRLNLKVYVIYFIIWLYILLISLHTFHFSNMETIILQNWQEAYDPFSDTFLENDENIT